MGQNELNAVLVSFHLFFMQNKHFQISLVSVTHIYFSLILHIACGLAASQLLFQYCLHSGIQLKGCSHPWERAIVMEMRKNNVQTTQWFLKCLFWKGVSIVSLIPLAKANHMSKPEINGLIQEGQQITENNNTGQHGWNQEDPT